MSQSFPETEDNPEAAEGEASHEIGASLIKAATRGGIDRPKREETVGTVATNGVIITDEMFDGAELYADDVIEVMRSEAVLGGPHIRVEERVSIPRIHELCFGTPDVSIYAQKNFKIYLWDYKFGHKYVDAFENWQAVPYFAGLMDVYNFDGILDQNIIVHIRIVQPRAYHRDGPIREWVIKASDLRAYINIMKNNAEISLSAEAVCRSGPHCYRCSARTNCDTATLAGMGLYEVASTPTPIDLSPQSIGRQLTIIKRAMDQLDFLKTGFEAQAEGLIRSGHVIPGWGLEPTFGNQKWSKPIKEVIELGGYLGLELKKDAAITPNQAKKLGISEEILKAYSETPRTGAALAPENSNKARQVFDNE
jgi:hypothetical protein